MSLVNRYKLPIDALDAVTLREAFLDYLEDAYDGELDRNALTRIISAQVDYTAMGVEAAMRVGERAGGEGSLASAVESQSIIDHAYAFFNYTPPGDVSARFAVTFTGDEDPTIIFPIGTEVSTVSGSGDDLQTFELEEEIIKPSGTTTVDGVVRHGTTRNLVKESDGAPGQIFELDGAGVDTFNVIVKVQNEVWTGVQSFGSSRPFDKHYRLRAIEFIPGDRRYQVLFGDGVLGLIPQAGDVINLQYVTGAGPAGNVGLGSIGRVSTPLVDNFNNNVLVQVTNTASLTRGRTHEHVDITRIKAPLRDNVEFSIVSKQDYESAALMVPGGAIRATAYNYEDLGPLWDPNSILLVMAVDFTDPATGPEVEAIVEAIRTTYNDNGTARLVGSAAPFEAIGVDIVVTLEVGYLVSERQPVIESVITEFFSEDSTEGPVPGFVVDIGKPISYSSLVDAIKDVDGVKKVALPNVDGFDEIVADAFNALPIVTAAVQVLPAPTG